MSCEIFFRFFISKQQIATNYVAVLSKFMPKIDDEESRILDLQYPHRRKYSFGDQKYTHP